MKSRTVRKPSRLFNSQHEASASTKGASVEKPEPSRSTDTINEAAALQDIANRIVASWQKAVESIIETGKLLIDAKRRIGYGNWMAFIEKLPFGNRTADCLMEIARHPILSDSKFISNLPPSWGTLHRLTFLDERELVGLLANGTINCETTRKDVDEQIKRMGDGSVYLFAHVPEALSTIYRFMVKWPDPNEIAASVYEHMIEGDHQVDLPDIPKLCDWLTKLHAACEEAKRSLDDDVQAHDETATEPARGSLNRTSKTPTGKRRGFLPSDGSE